MDELEASGPAEPAGSPGPADAAVGEERRYPSTIGGACYLAILLACGVGLGIAALGSWRTGIKVIAAALMVMAALRLTLRQRDAGMLAVRHRLVDALMLAGSAGVLFFLAVTIPDQPG